MALKKFIGARYAPEFAGAWSNAKQYAALSVVYADNRSYVSRKTVPAGTPITNTEFWIQSSDWNAQVAEYNLKVEGYNANVEQYNRNVQDYSAAVSGFYADTLHSFDTKADMQADRTLALGETLLTCGDKKIGDGGGSFYQVVSETSVTAVALDNGLFAEPFEFQPYDYSQFQTAVDEYKAETDQQITQAQVQAEAQRAALVAVSLRNYDNENAMIADRSLEENNTLLTSGKVAVGDGGGSFWKVKNSSDESGSVNLANGKKAVPFALQVYQLNDLINYNGSKANPAVVGMVSGATTTLRIQLAKGETKTAFTSAVYDTNSVTNTVVVEVSGETEANQTFSIKDNSSASNITKTVIYAFTAANVNGVIRIGYATVASYNTTMSDYVADLKVGIPNESNPLWNNDTKVYRARAKITPTQNVTLKGFTVNTHITENNNQTTVYITDKEGGLPKGALWATYNVPVTTGNTIKQTFYPNVVLAGNKNYWIVIEAVSQNIKCYQPAAITGTYGPFKLDSSRYSGILYYNLGGTPVSNITVNIPNSSTSGNAWDAVTVTGGETSSKFLDFTVNKHIKLISLTVNTSAFYTGSDRDPDYWGASSYYKINDGSYNTLANWSYYRNGKWNAVNAYWEPVIELHPGDHFVAYFTGSQFLKVKLPTTVNGTYGALTMNCPYAGTIEYRELD